MNREAVDTGIFSPVRTVQATLEPAIRPWANRFLIGISPSGSFAKGTANKSGTDIDLFISLSSRTGETLKEIYESLFTRMQEIGYAPKRQNVSINVRVGAYDVDLVPGKHQGFPGNDHSLYRRRGDTWTKTNVSTHTNHVFAAGRLSETRILKLWRNQKGLDFPSFYLELVVIKALALEFYNSRSGRECLEGVPLPQYRLSFHPHPGSCKHEQRDIRRPFRRRTRRD